jgi:hypothetical protein
MAGFGVSLPKLSKDQRPRLAVVAGGGETRVRFIVGASPALIIGEVWRRSGVAIGDCRFRIAQGSAGF